MTSADAAPFRDEPALPVRHRWLLMIAVMGASIIQFLDATIANVAVPHMQTSLGATFDSVTWVLTSFIIASAVATPIVGWLADQIGSRRLFLIAVAGFTLASMLCGIATSLPEMVGFRILQGIFAALIGPLSQTIMLDINPPSKHAQALGIWGMAVMVAPISGPMLGGWLTENYSWRWIFYINLPIGIPTLLILWWLLPSRPVQRRRLDYLGFGLLAVGLAALQLMLDRGQGEDWFQSNEIIIEAGVAAACLWMFGVHIMTRTDTIIPHALLRNRNFLTTLLLMVGLGVVMMALAALLPPLLQNLLGYPVIDTGLLMAPRGFGVLISMWIATRCITIVGPRALVATGFGIAALSLWLMSRWSLDVTAEIIIANGFLQGLGMGLCFMPINMLAFATVPVANRTDGSGLMILARSLGASMGISLMTTMLARNIQTSHSDLVQQITSTSIAGIDLSAADRLGEIGVAGLQMIDAMVNRQATMIAYINDFWMMAIIVALCVPLTWIAKNPPPLASGAAPPSMD